MEAVEEMGNHVCGTSPSPVVGRATMRWMRGFHQGTGPPPPTLGSLELRCVDDKSEIEF